MMHRGGFLILVTKCYYQVKMKLNQHKVFLKLTVGFPQNVPRLFIMPRGLDLNMFGDTQEPHPRTFLLRHPLVKMSKQIAVKFPDLTHAVTGINHFNTL